MKYKIKVNSVAQQEVVWNELIRLGYGSYYRGYHDFPSFSIHCSHVLEKQRYVVFDTDDIKSIQSYGQNHTPNPDYQLIDFNYLFTKDLAPIKEKITKIPLSGFIVRTSVPAKIGINLKIKINYSDIVLKQITDAIGSGNEFSITSNLPF